MNKKKIISKVNFCKHKRLSKSEWLIIRFLYENNIECKEIAAYFDIAVTTIWRHVKIRNIKRKSLNDLLNLYENSLLKDEFRKQVLKEEMERLL